MRFTWDRAAEALATWAELVPNLPRETMSAARLEKGAERRLVVIGLHLGTEDEANQLLAPLLALTSNSNVTRRDFVEALMLEAGCSDLSVEECRSEGVDAGGAKPRQNPFAASSHYIPEPLSADLIATAMAAVDALPDDAVGCNVQFDSYGGAIADVAPDATAFVHRTAFCSAQYFIAFDGDGAASRSWVRATYEAMAPYSNGESYQNYVDPGLDGWADAYYGANLARLQDVKRRFDPDDVFSFPQSIPL
jgi:FAD/FMN-containing dehydrogenase